jgi:hypothetical protein
MIDEMKLFSLEEANELLPSIRRRLTSMQKQHRRLIGYQDAARHAAEGATFGGGGMPAGSDYIAVVTDFLGNVSEIEGFGVQIKDYGKGLIDFPSLRDDRVVLLCWQLGEGDTIEYWHDTETGFAGRQRL